MTETSPAILRVRDLRKNYRSGETTLEVLAGLDDIVDLHHFRALHARDQLGLSQQPEACGPVRRQRVNLDRHPAMQALVITQVHGALTAAVHQPHDPVGTHPGVPCRPGAAGHG